MQKHLWDRTGLHNRENILMDGTFITSAEDGQCSTAAKIAENILAAEQTTITSAEFAKSNKNNNFNEIKH